MSLCNYCALEDIKRRAKETNKKVTVRDNAKWGMGGVNVYMHPSDVRLSNVIEDSKIHDKYFVAWFMELPNHCCC